jgi:1,2-diacylglycerol 3-beta-galactosyltransferase
MADLPPHFWQEKQDQHLICGTSYAMRQALATKWYRAERLHQTSGMIVRPEFYASSTLHKMSLRQFGFTPSKPTALIMFGGYGSTLSEQIVDRVNEAGIDLQMIVMCGKNLDLFKRLKSKHQCYPVSYTNEIASYMRLCDFMIGKPGPGSLSEAWHMGLPVIVEANARTMVQERPNIAILQEYDAGIVIKNFRLIAPTVKRLLSGKRLQTLKMNVRRLRNNAVFEIPKILDHIMDDPASGSRPKGLRAPRKLRRLAQKIRGKARLNWR